MGHYIIWPLSIPHFRFRSIIFRSLIGNFQLSRIILPDIDHFRCKVAATKNTLIGLVLCHLVDFIPIACHNMSFCTYIIILSLLLYYVRQSSIYSNFKTYIDYERLSHKTEVVWREVFSLLFLFIILLLLTQYHVIQWVSASFLHIIM